MHGSFMDVWWDGSSSVVLVSSRYQVGCWRGGVIVLTYIMKIIHFVN